MSSFSSATERELASRLAKGLARLPRCVGRGSVRLSARVISRRQRKSTPKRWSRPAAPWTETLVGLTEFNDKGAEAAGQTAEDTYWNAIRSMIVILVGGIVLGLGAAMLRHSRYPPWHRLDPEPHRGS